MNSDSKVIKLIAMLVRKTGSGDIHWALTKPPKLLTSATEDEIYSYFQAHYNSKIVAIYERKSKYFHDEYAFHWTSSNVFAILDKDENPIMEYPSKAPVLDDLFTTVRIQVADIDNLLDDWVD